jgi:uncharacterized protein (TIGR03067 family)
MRIIIPVFLLILSIGCNSTKKFSKEPGYLNGTWQPVQQEMGGVSLPMTVFEKQKLIINDTLYTVIAESIDKGVVMKKDNKMDIYGREGVNAGRHFTAIYKYENEQLAICYNLKGDSYPESFETKGKPMYFLSVFKKEFSK